MVIRRVSVKGDDVFFVPTSMGLPLYPAKEREWKWQQKTTKRKDMSAEQAHSLLDYSVWKALTDKGRAKADAVREARATATTLIQHLARTGYPCFRHA